MNRRVPQIRLKSQWFKSGRPRDPKEIAAAMAFNIWRIAQHGLRRMRAADFDIDAGPQYFAFTREFLVFLINVADRVAYEKLEAAARLDFTTTLVTRVAETLEDNQAELLGPAPGRGYRGELIDLFNERSPDYAEFSFTQEGPDYSFLRYVAHRMLELVPEKDQAWVVAQMVEVEAPEAASLVQKSLADLLSTDPRPARAGRARLSGD